MAPQHAEHRLAAILAADVAGYSRLMEADEQATVATLDACRALFRKTISAHGGRIVDTAGDSVLAIFPSAIGAVEAAIELQRDLHERNNRLPEAQRMRFRIGINLGDVIEKDDGSIYGTGVNVAARLESLAEPGGISMSGSAHEQVEGKLEVSFVDIGEHEVKNIARPVRAYRIEDDTAPTTPSTKSLTLPDKPTIAVLPFDNMSGDADQEYFSDGLTEDIITKLSRFDGLSVVARNSTFQYKAKASDVRVVARELGANYVIEGSVRRAANRIRVSAQLLSAEDGNHVWAETYDNDLDAAAIFSIQDDITEKVAGTIADTYGVISRVELESRESGTNSNLDIYDNVLRARAFYRRRGTADEHRSIRAALEQAVEKEPGNADAWSWLAAMYRDEHSLALNPRPDPLARAESAARRAIELDADNQQGHLVLACVHFFRHQLDRFEIEAERTVSLNPLSVDALGSMGVYTAAAGNLKRGIELVDRATALSPSYPSWFHYVYAWDHYRQGNYEHALAEAHKIEREALILGNVLRCACYVRLDRMSEARAELARLRELRPDITLARASAAHRRWNIPDDLNDSLLEGLREAGLDDASG